MAKRITVGELINELQQFPVDAPVMVEANSGYSYLYDAASVNFGENKIYDEHMQNDNLKVNDLYVALMVDWVGNDWKSK